MEAKKHINLKLDMYVQSEFYKWNLINEVIWLVEQICIKIDE